MPDVEALVADLAAEQEGLQALLGGIAAPDWRRPTPSEGWDVRDSVAHLAHTDEVALDTVIDGPHSLNRETERFSSAEEFTEYGCEIGRSMTGPEVLDWWCRASATERDALATADPSMRVPWGLGMALPSFVSARFMETWAHGLDIRAALDAPPDDTDRIAHVAWIGVRALPYAFTFVSREAPPGTLRVELELPSGAPWTSGPDDATDRITGPAAEFCRVFVQRMARNDATGLTADGPLAEAALEVARAYL